MEIKGRIIQKVQELEDQELLHLLEDWLNAVLDTEEDISSEELSSVMEGYAEYKKGNLIDDEEVQKLFQRWLNEE